MPVNAERGRSGPEPQSGAGADGSAGQLAVAGHTAAGRALSLRAVDLTLGFGAKDILSNMSADMQPGAVTALIGPTGSGKTTLLRTLNRMNDKVSGYRHTGDVLFDGRSIWHPAVELMLLRRQVGMLFQRPNPFPMSIMDNVTAGPRAHRLARRRELKEIARHRLTQVGLWDAVAGRLGASPFRLSGGQQQLLCLARALAITPQVLLLDEPTSSLDPVAAVAIETLIRTLVPSLTIVIVTHNLAQARRVSDRTMFVYQGRLIEHGDTAQVLEHPAQAETIHYVAGRYG